MAPPENTATWDFPTAWEEDEKIKSHASNAERRGTTTGTAQRWIAGILTPIFWRQKKTPRPKGINVLVKFGAVYIV